MRPARVVALVLPTVLTACAALLDVDTGVYVPLPDAGPTEPPPELLARLHNGLVGYWRFEGNGSDSTDAGFDLSLAKPELPETYDVGRIGRGWIPGLADSDECPTCNLFEYDASGSELQTTRDFTLSVWVRPDANPAADRWFEYGIFENEEVRIVGEAYNISPAPCHPAVFIMKNGAVVTSVRDPMFDFRDPSNQGRWNHLVAFRKGTTVGLWINQYLTTTTQASPGGEGVTGSFRVGGMEGGRGWQGALDELGIWNRALEDDELNVLYNHGRGAALFP
jgi:hypothetical protein